MRNVRVAEVPASCKSLNKGDSFVLDLGLKLFLWNGPESNRREMAKAVEIATKLRNERGAKPEIFFIDEEPENAEFWGELEDSPADVRDF
jgi:gelsolin